MQARSQRGEGKEVLSDREHSQQLEEEWTSYTAVQKSGKKQYYVYLSTAR